MSLKKFVKRAAKKIVKVHKKVFEAGANVLTLGGYGKAKGLLNAGAAAQVSQARKAKVPREYGSEKVKAYVKARKATLLGTK